MAMIAPPAPKPACNECPVAVRAPESVKVWLKAQNLPPEAIHYFKLIADQQEAIQEKCG